MGEPPAALRRQSGVAPNGLYAQIGLLLEGVNEGKPGDGGEVIDIAGGQFMAAGPADAGDLSVGQRHGPPGGLGGYQDRGGLLSCRQVVDHNGVGEGVHQVVPLALEFSSPPPGREEPEASFDLLHGHNTDAQVSRRDGARPGYDHRIGVVPHELGHHVGVSDDHDRSTGRG